MKKPQSDRWVLLDILRGLSCFAVVLFHSLGAFQPNNLNPFLAFVQKFTTHGWMAVYLFFVLSGWCMAERLSYSLKKNESPITFALNRVFRIYPVYWIVLIVSIVLRLMASPWNNTSFASNLPEGYLALFSDVFLVFEFSNLNPYLLVAWTLGVEVLFYLACAVGLVLWKKGFSGFYILLLAVLFSLLSFIWPMQPGKTFMDCLPCFLWGLLAWRFCYQKSRAWMYAALFMLSLFGAIGIGGWKMTDSLALLFTLLLVILRKYGFQADSLPFRKTLVWLGTLSYSLYLVHVPVLSPFLNLAERLVSSSEPLFTVIWLLALASSILVSWCLYSVIEKKTEAWRKAHLLPTPNTLTT